MFNTDEMEGCHSCKYGENFDTDKDPCKHCYGLSMYTKKMEISIEEHIGVIEDLKSTMSVCMPDPEKTEICASLNEAINIMRQYKKIEQILDDCDLEAWEILEKIREVVEERSDN